MGGARLSDLAGGRLSPEPSRCFGGTFTGALIIDGAGSRPWPFVGLSPPTFPKVQARSWATGAHLEAPHVRLGCRLRWAVWALQTLWGAGRGRGVEREAGMWQLVWRTGCLSPLYP